MLLAVPLLRGRAKRGKRISMKDVIIKISEIDSTAKMAVILIYYNNEKIGGGYTSYTANSSGYIDSTWLNEFAQEQVDIYDNMSNNMVVHT